uniref:Gustatory receptor n=1 Tax=Anopheles albimanus TaxID=7167 RepID=A0A182FZW3_ANOAL
MSIVRLRGGLELFLLKVLEICALLPLKFDQESRRFVKTRRDVLYCVVLVVLFVIWAPFVFFHVFVQLFGAFGRMISALIGLQFLFVYMFLIIAQITLLRNGETIKGILNEMVIIREIMQMQYDFNKANVFYTKRLLFKVLIVDFGLLLLSLVVFFAFREDTLSLIELLTSLIFYLTRYFITMVVTFIVMCLLLCDSIQSTINHELRQLAQGRTVGVSKPDPSIRHMYKIHCKCAVLVGQFMDKMNLPLLLLNAWYFFMLMVSVFYACVTIIVDVGKEGTVRGAVKYLNPATFFVYIFTQIYYLTMIPSRCTANQRKMFRLLVQIARRSGDLSMERLMDAVIVDHLQRDYSIQNYGMYSIDNQFLFGMIATVASFVIILVQFYIQNN